MVSQSYCSLQSKLLVVLTLLVTTYSLCCCCVTDLSAAVTCLDFSPFILDLFLVSIIPLPVNCCMVFVGKLSENFANTPAAVDKRSSRCILGQLILLT